MNTRRPPRFAPPPQSVDANRLRPAHFAAGVFATAFTVWTAVTLLLVLTINVARSERLGFAAVTGAAALAMWTVFVLISQARRVPGTRTWTARATTRVMTRLRTPRR